MQFAVKVHTTDSGSVVREHLQTKDVFWIHSTGNNFRSNIKLSYRVFYFDVRKGCNKV